MTSELKYVQFTTLSTEQIRKLSVVEIESHDVFDKGIPKQGALSDLRLGTIDRQFKCQTCKHDALGCPGHFGHIELAYPVHHVCFMKTVTKILQCLCFNCKKVKVDIENLKRKSNNSKQLKYVHDLLKSKLKCNHCEEIIPKIISDKTDIFIEKEIKEKLSTQTILELFRSLSNEDLNILGFDNDSHPANFIFEVILVPPPHVRPSVSMDTSLKSMDDLTHKLCEIVKTNNMIKKNLEQDNQQNMESQIDLLQYHVTTYIDNGIPGIVQATQRTGRPIKAICQRLKTKDGRVRGNLMGKRVNFSARTVITAEPSIDLDELGVPWVIAKTLSFPETVTPFNIKTLQQYVNNGPEPEFGTTGAKTVKRNDIERDLRFVNDFKLEFGDVVERHLIDGDLVVFNRQPSLHKMSMMGHRVKIMKHLTFRMNVCATTPYNADYDGDEMNLHAPQTQTTRAEVSELMMVSKNIVSPQSNKPVIGIIQDSLLGSHKITKKDVFIPKHLFFDIYMRLKNNKKKMPKPAIFKPEELYTGKQVIELLLPDDFNFEKKGAIFKEDENMFFNDGITQIVNGKYVMGNICKKSLGTSEMGIIHLLWLEYGPETANRFISNIQYAVNHWLNINGFSVGGMDIYINEDAGKAVDKAILDSKSKVQQIIQICENKNIDVRTYENKINQTLNNAMSQAGLEVQNNLDHKNNINATVTGGSKGSMFNIAQIMGCVGQQNVAGKRVSFGYIDRVLPHFKKGDVGPEAKGFVEHSYKEGLDPHEFFYHAMGGREGIIDTAIKTSETGYIQRRLIKAMEDIKISFDKSLRNSIGDIIQFVYGYDGLDATHLVKEKFNVVPIETFIWDSAPDAEIDNLKEIMTTLKSSFTVLSPFLIDRVISKYKRSQKPNVPPNSSTVFLKVKDFCDGLTLFYRNDSSIKSMMDYYSLYMLRALVYTRLNSKFVCNNLTFESFENILSELSRKFQKSLVQDGEMVGTVAAQSLGQPCTQLTLNSVIYDTPVLLEINGNYEKISIGKYIDNRIENATLENIENHENDTILEHIRDDEVKILSALETGEVIWDNVEAVTRHPVVNKDGSNTLIKVTLNSGRTITATKAKGFIKRIDNKLQGVTADELIVGDYLPISEVLNVENIVTHWNISGILSKNEYVYRSEVDKALLCQKNDGHNWWSKNQFTTFTIPYNRSDSFIRAYVGGIRGKYAGKPKRVYEEMPDCIYPKCTTAQSAHIPERFILDSDFGFFIGAYLAEGCCTKYAILISNLDDDFNLRIDKWCKLYGIKYHIDDNNGQMKNNGFTKTLRLHSMVLAQILSKTIGTGSADKIIPAVFLQAPDEFLKGLIDGYFSGDGTISKKQSGIYATSVSKELIDGIQCILRRFNIKSSIRSQPKVLEYNKNKGYNAKLPYVLSITAEGVLKFKETFIVTIKEKQDILHARQVTELYKNHVIIPDVKLKNKTENLSMKQIENMKNKANVDDLKIFEEIERENVWYDKIISIEEIENPFPWVYDFTTTHSRNFSDYSGAILRDTFHAAGISAKNVTLGVPRFKELINVAKSIKSPSMHLVLKEEYRNAESADDIAHEIETLQLQTLLERSEIIEMRKEDLQYFEIPDEGEIEYDFYEYGIRYTFNKEKTTLSMLDISVSIMLEYEALHCIPIENTSQIYVFICNDQGINLDSIKMLNSKLKTEHIKGNVMISKVYVDETDYSLDTDGSCFKEMLHNKYVQAELCTTNDINEIKETLGIEAARHVLMKEIKRVLEFDGTYVNERHFHTLVDTMTYKGALMAVTRHGINRSENGPLMKCSFEETVDVLCEAAVSGEKDLLRGVTENITVGKIANMGTGTIDIIYDGFAKMNTEVKEIKAKEYKPLEIESNDDYTSCVYSDSDDSCIESYF